MAAEFVSLHNHFDKGSALDGYGKAVEYIERTKQLNQRALGQTDHGMNAGLYEFISLCNENGIDPVPGCELYVAPINPLGARVKESVFYGKITRNKQGRLVAASPNDVSSQGAYLHLTAWAVNQTGLHNLFKLSSKSWQVENYYKKNRVDFDMIEEHSEGLVVSTGCPSSEISTRFLLGQDKKAYEYASRLKDVFGDRLFVEVMNHHMSIDLETKLLPKQLELSKKLNIPLLATNDCHYARESDAPYHEELLCMQSGSKMSDKSYDDGGGRFVFNGNEYYLKTAEQMAEIFPERDFPGALSNTLLVAEMAKGITVQYDPELMISPPIPENEKNDISYFNTLIREGFERRFANHPEDYKQAVRERINTEFEIIYSSGFVGYFIAVKEYIHWANDKYAIRNQANEIIAHAVGVGRGSVGGSMIAYVLGISEVDPIRHDLLFERFMTAGRGATYLITYDDGTTEEVVISDKKILVGKPGANGKPKTKYIHQLKPGDVVEEEVITSD